MSDTESPIDQAHARELLRRERERIEGSLADMERVRRSELDEIATDTDPLDAGEQIEEEEVDAALRERLQAELDAVERAERRLEDGIYGLSVESGEPIAVERLEAIPWAERTSEEQERYERTHGRTL